MEHLSEVSQLESWLTILTNSYKDNPSIGLAKVINYYIDRIILHEDFDDRKFNNCQYSSMKKYWQWLSLPS